MKKLILFTFTLTTIFAVEIDFNHNGWDREAYLYKPSCVPDNPNNFFEPVPLVMMFHGLGGIGADNYAISTLAEDSCFIVAFPSGLFNTWNVGPEAGFSHDIDDNSYALIINDMDDDFLALDTSDDIVMCSGDLTDEWDLYYSGSTGRSPAIDLGEHEYGCCLLYTSDAADE